MGEYSEQTKHAVARLSVRSLAGEPGGPISAALPLMTEAGPRALRDASAGRTAIRT